MTNRMLYTSMGINIYYSLTVSLYMHGPKFVAIHVIDRWLLYKFEYITWTLIMKLCLYISWLHAVTTIRRFHCSMHADNKYSIAHFNLFIKSSICICYIHGGNMYFIHSYYTGIS